MSARTGPGSVVRVRLMGTRAECAAAAGALGEVLDVVGVSEFRPNRGSTVLGRVYLDAWLDDAGAVAGAVPAPRPARRAGRERTHPVGAGAVGGGVVGEVASLRAELAEANARRHGLAVELLTVQHIAGRLADAARAADAALDDEHADRQVVAEELIGAVCVAVRDLDGGPDDEDDDQVDDVSDGTTNTCEEGGRA